MLKLRGLSTPGRPVSLALDRPVRTTLGTFAPAPDRLPVGIVLTVHPVDAGSAESPHAAACRAYLSQGLAAPNAILSPLGWLIDVAA